jgi:uncharacterized protein (DUF486 family)
MNLSGLAASGLLLLSNPFMTMACYGHLRFKEWGWFGRHRLLGVVLITTLVLCL